MFVLTTVTRDCKNGDLYVSVDDNAYLTKEAASAALRARYEDFLKSMELEDNGASDENGNAMFLLQNVYTSKESTSYIVSSKLLQTLEAAIKERDDAVEDAVVNHYGDYNEDSIDIQEGANSKCICGPDFMDVWFITNLNDVDSDDLGTDYPIVEVNPEDDIKYVLEESGAYDEEIERMTENGTYEEFIRKVKERIDWNNLQGRMIQAENEAISAAIDTIINKG